MRLVATFDGSLLWLEAWRKAECCAPQPSRRRRVQRFTNACADLEFEPVTHSDSGSFLSEWDGTDTMAADPIGHGDAGNLNTSELKASLLSAQPHWQVMSTRTPSGEVRRSVSY